MDNLIISPAGIRPSKTPIAYWYGTESVGIDLCLTAFNFFNHLPEQIQLTGIGIAFHF